MQGHGWHEDLMALSPTPPDHPKHHSARGRLALVRGREIEIGFLGAEGRPCDHRRSEILWASSPVTQVRWRPVGPASDTFAVIEAGGARDGAVVVHKALDESWGWRERRQDSYVLHHGDAWAVEWEPTRGERLVVGVSRGTPLKLLDLQAQQWVAPHLGSSLHSDCFAPAWLSPDSALLGLRNGEVRLADFRCPLRGAPTTTLPLVNRMGNVVDQVAALRDGRGIVVSDRLGGLHLGDLRVPGTFVGQGVA